MTIQNSTPPSILFLCVHNAGRSQMAAGLTHHLGGGSVRVYSGGSEPADRINPAAIAAMAEIGIDIATQTPQKWTDEVIAQTDVVITMGCGDTCPVSGGVSPHSRAFPSTPIKPASPPNREVSGTCSSLESPDAVPPRARLRFPRQRARSHTGAFSAARFRRRGGPCSGVVSGWLRADRTRP